MTAVNSTNDTWMTTNALTTRLRDYKLFNQHEMEMPAKISHDNLQRAARLLDQHDPSTTIADGKAPELITYNHKDYTVNGDLRPMAEAAGMRNLREDYKTKKHLADALNQWDVDHAPRMAAFLPPARKHGGEATVPSPVIQTQQDTAVEPSKSKKRKAESDGFEVPSKRRVKAQAIPEDDEVAMRSQDAPEDGDFAPQPTANSGMSTRSPAPARTRLREPRNGQALDTRAPESGMAKKKKTRASTAKKNLNEDGTVKTAEQLAEEQILIDEALESQKNEARRWGCYSDNDLAKEFRVKHKTVLISVVGETQEGIDSVPTDQLGMWEYRERFLDEAKKAGRKVGVWMGGGPSPPDSSWTEDGGKMLDDS